MRRNEKDTGEGLLYVINQGENAHLQSGGDPTYSWLVIIFYIRHSSEQLSPATEFWTLASEPNVAFSIFLYGLESWTIRAQNWKEDDALEMCWRKMLGTVKELVR
ncbi:unnamed protein product [Pieris brassicae]|uniref:Uncharacterized protein n=1 Tax=Pieris brassicae TaxID=7116 RepID=A0A9P0TT33_PIEBR|nr:unnamed protein product [Pieris brassicae]